MDGYVYGCDLTQAKFKKPATKMLFRMLKGRNSALLDDFWRYKKDHDAFKNWATEEDAFEDFCSEHYENETYLWGGFDGLLVDFINEQEFDSHALFRSQYNCVYVLPDIPATEEDKGRYPSRQKIQTILAKYLNPLLEELVAITWLYGSEWD